MLALVACVLDLAPDLGGTLSLGGAPARHSPVFLSWIQALLPARPAHAGSALTASESALVHRLPGASLSDSF